MEANMRGDATAVDPNKNSGMLAEALASVRESIVPVLDSNGKLIFDGADNPITTSRYREEDSRNVINAVLRRSKQLSGYIYQLVRVARMAAFCSSNKPIQNFFFSKSVQLTRTHFQQIIAKAIEENRLPPEVARIVRVQQGTATIEFVESAMRGDVSDAPYRLSYGNIPPVAAIYEILCYALTSEVVKSILQPVMTHQSVTTDANTVARKLCAKFSAWLTDALGKSHAARNAIVIQRYLARHSALSAGSINDDIIFNFWAEHAALEDSSAISADDVKGFRIYRNAATSLLRFERALSLSQRRVGEDFEIADRVPFNGQPDDPYDFFLPQQGVEIWRSPVARLFSPPCLPVKWLTPTQARRLRNYIDGYSSARERRPQTSDNADGIVIPEECKGNQTEFSLSYAKLSRLDGPTCSLMGVDRFDLRFTLTLLRVDVFGAAQSRIINNLRFQKNALALELERNPKAAQRAGNRRAEKHIKQTSNALNSRALKLRPDDLAVYIRNTEQDHFVLVKAIYARVRHDVRKTIFASIKYLLDLYQKSVALCKPNPSLAMALITLVCRVGSAIILNYCTGTENDKGVYEEQIRQIRAKLDGDVVFELDKGDQYTRSRFVSRNLILAELKYSEFEDNLLCGLMAATRKKTGIPEVDAFIQEIKRANIHRVGFQQSDRADLAVQNAHCEAAEHLTAVLKDLDDLDAAIECALRKDRDLFDHDREKFTTVFEILYCDKPLKSVAVDSV
jgi:hypothetical protein